MSWNEISKALVGQKDALEATVFLVAIATAIISLVSTLIRRAHAKYRRAVAFRALAYAKYLRRDITEYSRYYVEPDFQSVDPGGGEDSRLVLAARQPAFSLLDELFSHVSQHQHVIVLADSGMGKSALLLNYYLRHMRRFRRAHEIAIFPFSEFDERKASLIERQEDTVVFLDALDEDLTAIGGLSARLAAVLKAGQHFKKILITCRTQFFSRDEEIPRETGVLRHGPRDAGESHQRYFHKVYLAPFNDHQISRYLSKRYGFWRRRRRIQAKRVVLSAPQVSVRPMLLAHIEEFLESGKPFHHTFQVYESMVDAWLRREEGFAGIRASDLREFSERVALDMFSGSQARGRERLTKDEVLGLATAWRIPLDSWQITGRSLLNRDAEGMIKFAHRSIGEWLFVVRFLKTPLDDRVAVTWTDQMKRFLIEMARASCVRPDQAESVGVDSRAVARNPTVPAPLPRFALGSLRYADLSRSSMVDMDFVEADLRRANLDNCKLSRARFLRADLVGATLRGTDLFEVNLEGADLSQANLQGAMLNWLSLFPPSSSRDHKAWVVRARGTDFRGAVLTGDAVLEDPASERLVDRLKGSQWEGATVPPFLHETIRRIDPDATIVRSQETQKVHWTGDLRDGLSA